ncbi:hypothetical protein [Burkholderia diffusa]|uniref:hypothetical protein n=1 Tax=Burkholderia diffusa TaxID=488732 RepID=UPI00158F4BEA|nr:hypothetical protein [Burkholderia diffusa]
MKFMTRTSQKTAELTKLLGIFDQVVSLLASYQHPVLLKFKDSWDAGRNKYSQALAKGVSASTLTEGVKQGLRGASDFMNYIPTTERRDFIKKYNQIILNDFPEFFDNDEKKIGAIIKRGKIRSEDEFYLVEFFFERQHEANPDGEDTIALRRIMDEFEFGGR